MLLRPLLLSLLLASVASAETIQVSVAVSLKEAITGIATDYKKSTGDDVSFTFGSSGQLATQIQNGAPADVFISAANKQVDSLIHDHLADASTRRVIATNTLVLIVPAHATEAPTSLADLAKSQFKKIAIGDPKTVPAGDYAIQTLTALKLKETLTDRLIFGSNVRQVLAYVETGDVAAGLVYATDAQQSGDKIKLIATAPQSSHQPIVYPAVVLTASTHRAAAQKFLDYLTAESAQKILLQKGFSLPPSATTAPAKP